MTTNHRPKRAQQQRVQHVAANSDAYTFFDLLTGPELLDEVESQLPEHRERAFPPAEALSMYLAQALSADRSCQKAVNDKAIKQALAGLSTCSTRTGGYCKARQRIPTEMVSHLARYTGELIQHHVPNLWNWKDRRVCLIDGTTALMPDTEANQSSYPQHKGIKQGLGFPICRIVGVVCLSSGAVLNAAIGRFNGKGSSEQTLLRTLLDTFSEGDLIVGDAFFGTYALLAALLEKGVDGVFEQHGSRRRSVDFSKGKDLGKRDHLIELEKPKQKPGWMSDEHYQSLPESICVRELSVDGKVLMTTLLSPKQASKHELKMLYKQRWHVELDFRHIKTTLGMDMLSCKTPKMNEKEIWVYLLAYNLIRLLMLQAAILANVLPRQLSFKHTVQLWQAWSQQNTDSSDENARYQLFTLIAQCLVGNRPGRVEPRVLKRRPKTYPLLMKERAAAREDIRKHGHPKKLK